MYKRDFSGPLVSFSFNFVINNKSEENAAKEKIKSWCPSFDELMERIKKGEYQKYKEELRKSYLEFPPLFEVKKETEIIELKESDSEEKNEPSRGKAKLRKKLRKYADKVKEAKEKKCKKTKFENVIYLQDSENENFEEKVNEIRNLNWCPELKVLLENIKKDQEVEANNIMSKTFKKLNKKDDKFIEFEKRKINEFINLEESDYSKKKANEKCRNSKKVVED